MARGRRNTARQDPRGDSSRAFGQRQGASRSVHPLPDPSSGKKEGSPSLAQPQYRLFSVDQIGEKLHATAWMAALSFSKFYHHGHTRHNWPQILTHSLFLHGCILTTREIFSFYLSYAPLLLIAYGSGKHNLNCRRISRCSPSSLIHRRWIDFAIANC